MPYQLDINTPQTSLSGLRCCAKLDKQTLLLLFPSPRCLLHQSDQSPFIFLYVILSSGLELANPAIGLQSMRSVLAASHLQVMAADGWRQNQDFARGI